MINIRIASMRSMDISNGNGIGVALFVQGCHFHCYNCFNQETWDFKGGKEWNEKIKERFFDFIDKPYISRVSLLGGEPLADENLDGVLSIIKEINNRYNREEYGINNKNSCEDNISETNSISNVLLKRKKIWLYTGYKIEDIFSCDLNDCENENTKIRQEIVKHIDVLIDGRYVHSLQDISLKWCGSKNQRVIDIKKSINKNGIVLWTT